MADPRAEQIARIQQMQRQKQIDRIRELEVSAKEPAPEQGLTAKYLSALSWPREKLEGMMRYGLDAAGVPEGPKQDPGPSMGEVMDKRPLLKGEEREQSPDWMYQKPPSTTLREKAVQGAGMYFDPINKIAPWLGKGAAAVENPTLKQLLEKSVPIAERVTNPLGTAGEAVVKGAQLTGQGAKNVSRFVSGFSKDETKQFLENKPKVNEFKNLLEDRMNIDVAQGKARGAIQNMIGINDQAVEAADRALQALHDGHTPVTADLNALQMLKGDPRAAPILARMEQNLSANQPMRPEFETNQTSQTGAEFKTPAKIVDGHPVETSPDQAELFVPEAAQRPEYTDITHDGRPSSAKRVEPDQHDMFTPEGAQRPEYTDITHDGRASSTSRVEPEQAEMFQPINGKRQQSLFLDDAKVSHEPGVLPEQAASNPLTKEEQLKILLEPDSAQVTKVPGVLPGQAASNPLTKEQELMLLLEGSKKVEKTPASMAPGHTETFPSEPSEMSSAVSEPLDLKFWGDGSRERAPVSKSDLRILRNRAGKHANFYEKPGNGGSVAGNEEWGDLYQKTNDWLKRTPEEQALDQNMHDRILTREELEKGLKNPLGFLKTSSEDARARIAGAAKSVNDTNVFDTTNQLGAARKIIGSTDGNAHGWWKRYLTHAAGRGGLNAVDALQNSSTMGTIGEALQAPAEMPQSLWLQMLQNKEKQK